jgi:hypothetical protein
MWCSLPAMANGTVIAPATNESQRTKKLAIAFFLLKKTARARRKKSRPVAEEETV